jgi:hypothetical protein
MRIMYKYKLSFTINHFMIHVSTIIMKNDLHSNLSNTLTIRNYKNMQQKILYFRWESHKSGKKTKRDRNGNIPSEMK